MEEKPKIEPALVAEFVGVAHSNFERVEELLSLEPALVNSAWDWGAGDWETALGAAAHMGRRDIAEYLLDNGARIDLFSAAMLGKLSIVKALIADTPGLKNSMGPHGIPLIVHAYKGGYAAAEVVAFLEAEAE